MMKRVGITFLMIMGALLIAVGYGRFVYPTNPHLVWLLLMVCWLCYRLHRRALETFGPRSEGTRELGRRRSDQE